MIALRYVNDEGKEVRLEVGDAPVTIGRSPDADLTIRDEKASRFHCGIRAWDEDFILRDLKSRNGTYLNGERIELCELKVGDRLTVGARTIHVEGFEAKGTDTIMREVGAEMLEGRGYHTILRQIVKDTSAPKRDKG